MVLRVKGISHDGTPIKPLIIEATNEELNPRHFQETNFLKTVVVVVPTNQVKDFEATYQALDDGTSGESNGANAEESSNLIPDAIANGVATALVYRLSSPTPCPRHV